MLLLANLLDVNFSSHLYHTCHRFNYTVYTNKVMPVFGVFVDFLALQNGGIATLHNGDLNSSI